MITGEQEKVLAELRHDIRLYMSGKRLLHTFAVEREAIALSAIYAPDSEYELRAAALLHDITKELSLEKQLQLCREFGIMYTENETLTPKIFHSRTAETVIKRDFSELAVPSVLSPIRWHTTGRDQMNLPEIILFLADFIEDTRTFESCVELRRFFYEGLSGRGGVDKWQMHLTDTMILAFDMTIKELLSAGTPIHPDTIAARNYFIVLKRGGLIEHTV